jgi:hypothetical protein
MRGAARSFGASAIPDESADEQVAADSAESTPDETEVASSRCCP